MEISVTTWQTLSKLLDEALDMEPRARAAWLEQLTATQPEIAPSVRKLLVAHASSGTADVMAKLPPLSIRLDGGGANAMSAGDRVGPYRLKSELGSGGMADVWLADRADGAFVREVALKLPLITRLRPGLARRFARERDILARLEHPHIARLYDAGVTDDGLPYLAMEYVDGQPITEYCDAIKLGIEARLRLFGQVLNAVQFAHANLVIHRDLKPSNILVTGDGQVRLLDFGIAKLLADDDTAHETQLTQLSGRALTPDYASPEQIKGQPLTIATDIYSLGVVLYELLAGRRPYRLTMQSAAQLEQAIVSTEPARPSSGITEDAANSRATTRARLVKSLGGDLDIVLLKALSKSSIERYPTASEFAQDLLNHLAGVPVQARPASWTYRVRKFVVRNRLPVIAASGVSAILIAATVVSVWQANVARDEAARAAEVKQFILSIFKDADTLTGGSRKTTAVDLLQQARVRLAATPVRDSSIAVELLTAIGFSLIGLGEYQQAAPVLEEATRLAEANLGEHHPATLDAQLALGEVLVLNGDSRAGAVLDAAERGTRRTANIAGLVRALSWQASLQGVNGRYDDAISNASEAVRLAEVHLASDKPVLQQAYMAQAAAMSLIHRPGRLEPARKAYLLAQEIHGDRVSSVVLEARSMYGYALITEGDAEQGVSELKALVPQQVALLGADHRDISTSLQRIALASLMRDDPLTAIDSIREALRIEAVHTGDRATNDVGVMHSNLGLALINARRYPDAELELHKANQIFAAMPEPNPSYVRMAQANTGQLLARTGRLDEADAIFARLFEQPFRLPLEEAAVKMRLITLRMAQGQYAVAERLAQEALDFFAKGSPPIAVATATAALGAAQLEGRREPEALDTLLQAKAHYDKLHLKTSPAFADLLVNVTRAQLALGRNEDAVIASGQAAEFWTSFDPANRSTGIALLWHARALKANGDAPKAMNALRQASEVLAKTGVPGDRPLLTQVRHELGTQLR